MGTLLVPVVAVTAAAAAAAIAATGTFVDCRYVFMMNSLSCTCIHPSLLVVLVAKSDHLAEQVWPYCLLSNCSLLALSLSFSLSPLFFLWLSFSGCLLFIHCLCSAR